MVRHPDPRKSGQAIIFLMVVLVIGILAVIWNFDLHRVISGKLRMRNAGDAAALAAARWQGHTLNMIGDLNLIQASLLSDAYAEYLTELDDYDPASGEPEPDFSDYYDITEMDDLHELRLRLEFIGPLAAFEVAQQAAFNNGAVADPALASNLVAYAEDLREEVARQPYDNAFDEYADLLENLAVRGVAVSSFSLQLRRHPLMNEAFYGAIAQALVDWWYPMEDFKYHLENYEDYESWPKLNTEFRYHQMFDLQLDDYSVGTSLPPNPPNSAVVGNPEFWDVENFTGYMISNEVVDVNDNGVFVRLAMWESTDVSWHVYDNAWAQQWPKPAKGADDGFAIRDKVKFEYDYMGAVAGISMAATVGRGILASTGNETVDLSYKAKAKPFGFLDINDGLVPPHYYGFVFPCFDDVRLVHSDIGRKMLSAEFYNHVTRHLEPYLDGGPVATDPSCSYCRLLVAWEDLDRKEGMEWLDRAYNDDDHNPSHPEVDNENPTWGEGGGGATGGS